jgi:hypothetical protein
MSTCDECPRRAAARVTIAAADGVADSLLCARHASRALHYLRTHPAGVTWEHTALPGSWADRLAKIGLAQARLTNATLPPGPGPFTRALDRLGVRQP